MPLLSGRQTSLAVCIKLPDILVRLILPESRSAWREADGSKCAIKPSNLLSSSSAAALCLRTMAGAVTSAHGGCRSGARTDEQTAERALSIALPSSLLSSGSGAAFCLRTIAGAVARLRTLPVSLTHKSPLLVQQLYLVQATCCRWQQPLQHPAASQLDLKRVLLSWAVLPAWVCKFINCSAAACVSHIPSVCWCRPEFDCPKAVCADTTGIQLLMRRG